MWVYEKKLQFPIKIKNPNPKMAQVILSQYGGPDGELGASLRYLSQRFAMPNEITKSTLNDIGTEELAHLCWKSRVKGIISLVLFSGLWVCSTNFRQQRAFRLSFLRVFF